MANRYPPMPFIVGVPRSGTTLLRLMLDTHPLLAIPPETGFLAKPLSWLRFFSSREAVFRMVTQLPFKTGPWRDFGLDAYEFSHELQRIKPFNLSEGFRAFYRLYARNQNKPRCGDKTPLYCRHMAKIEALLPEAHFIHIIRDGRDVALSLRPMWFSPGQDVQTLATYWSNLVQQTRADSAKCAAYLEIRYEELIANSESSLKTICNFLELDFAPAMLRYWERSRDRLREHKSRRGISGRIVVTQEQRIWQQRRIMEPPHQERAFCWKKEMAPAERVEFLRYAGATLQALNYEV